MKNTSMSTSALATVLVMLSVSAGCAHEETKPASSTSGVTVIAAAPPLAPAAPGKSNSTIYLSDRLRKACGITTVDTVKEAPTFNFDQNAILPEDRDVLALVAACLTTGPLKGHSVRLVGRADPRGTVDYNMALGERRANSVLKYLSGLGVGSSQLSETSRGALDANGGGEAAWKLDRRVDIDLLEGT